MASVIGDMVKVVFCLCLLGSSTAKLTLNGTWVKGKGYSIACYWEMLPYDTLQSLRIFKEVESGRFSEILVHRPEIHGRHHVKETIGYDYDPVLMNSSCNWFTSDSKEGICLAHFNFLDQNVKPVEDTFRCRTSGERPTFRLEEREYSFYVPPSAAVLKLTSRPLRPTLNCTSSGLPSPKLLWMVEGQKIPEDFTHTKWNSTSKLWDSWSSYNPQREQVTVVCTPEATTKTGRVERGQSAEWVVATNRSAAGIASVISMGPLLLLAILLRWRHKISFL